MVTKEQFANGVLTFMDSDVIPGLPTAGKWIVGSMIVLVNGKLTELLNYATEHPIVKALGIVDSNGLINMDILCDALCKSASRYGKLSFSVPLVGTLSFSEKDIESIKRNVINSYDNSNSPEVKVRYGGTY